ncbi:MAG: thioredoxin domain-containing protein [Bifidobacteriaceae bacterium]|jgi:protein-disulfide isomerase|nr:thioredoxin domain-containing protein [Bifidobacteriaceae bacterium]
MSDQRPSPQEQPDHIHTHGPGFVPWYKQAGAWVAIGAVVVACSLAMVIGAKSLANRAASDTASDSPSDSAAGSQSPGAEASADASPEADGNYDPVAKAECPATGEAPAAEAGKPAGATDLGGIALGCDGVPGGPVADATRISVEVMSDYICPFCQRFEEQVGPALEQAMRDGQVKVTVYPMGYLDDFSSTEYSSRAARAAVAVAGHEPGHYWAFSELLWQNQPPENGPGLSDQEIADLAREAGVADDTIAQFTTGAYDEWVAKTTANVAGSEGFQGTPWVLIGDGTNKYAWNWSEGDLQTAIAKVAAGQQPS